MAARDCRLLADLWPLLLAIIDQPADDPVQLGFPMSQIAQAASDSQEECHKRASQLDANIMTKEALLSVSGNATYLLLPNDLRAIRACYQWNATSNTKIREIPCGEWSQDGNSRIYDALFKPKDVEHDNKAVLYFLARFPANATIKIVYDYFPVRLFHGCLPVDAGALALKLADYEPYESEIYTGQRLYITQDPLGTAAGTSHPIGSYTGATQTAGFLLAEQWNPVPRAGATYTSRPDILRDWERLFLLEWAVQLGMKLPERIVDQWKKECERVARDSEHLANTLERRAAQIVRNTTGQAPMIGGDPINGPFFY